MLNSLQILNTGFCFQREFLVAKGARRLKVAIPVYVGVIQHPEAGIILFDTGYGVHYNAAVRPWPYRLMALVVPADVRQEWTVAAQLRKMGIALKDVSWIILSHLHNDHVAGLKDFPLAKIVCMRSGYDNMQAMSKFTQAAKGFLPHLLPDDFETRTTFIEDIKTSIEVPPWGVCTDFLGDGSIVFIPLEGHCRGQVGAFLSFADGRKVLLAADAYYLTRSLRNGQGPHLLTMSAADNPRAVQTSLNQLRAFRKLHPEIPVIASHCGEAAELYAEWFLEVPEYPGLPLAGVNN